MDESADHPTFIYPKEADMRTSTRLGVAVLAAAIPRLPELGLPPAMVAVVEKVRKQCDDVIAKGTVTEAERKGIRTMAQMLFLQAAQMR